MNIKIHHNRFFDMINILFDIILAGSSYYVAYKFTLLIYDTALDLQLMLVFVACMIFMLAIYEFYSKTIRKKYEICLSTGISAVISVAVTAIVKSIFREMFLDTHYLTFVLTIIITLVVFVLWKIILIKIVNKAEGIPKLLVIESNMVDNDLTRKVKYSYAECYEAWYTMIDVESEEDIKKTIESLDKYASVFISPNIPEDLTNLLVSRAVALNKDIFVLPNLYNLSIMRNEVVQFDDTPALRLKPLQLSLLQRIVKRAFDIAMSLVGIVFTLPIMFICAIAIRIDSAGPIIYKQERLTYYQKKFDIYKFRTMVNDAEKNTGAVIADENDPRITTVGKILRTLRLDELPQLFNILNGSMSIVGPRPEREVFVKQFCEEIANYDKRFFVKAGLTGLAQVYARYDTNASDKTLYDLLYIKDYSFWLDIKLVLMTVKVMFVKDSSEGVRKESFRTNRRTNDKEARL